MAMQGVMIALVFGLITGPALGQGYGGAAAPVARQQQRPEAFDAALLAAAGATREQQRHTIWVAAQAFCRVQPDDRMCTRPQ
jgi:hypothetical protein